MKNLTKLSVLAAFAFAVACGSQVVEFPNQCDCPANPKLEPAPTATEEVPPPPPPTEEDAGQPPVEEDAGAPADDAGTPADDAGTPAEDAGNPADDAGSPEADAGSDAGEGDVCRREHGNAPLKCGAQHGCCVSTCAHTCNELGGKHHKDTCHVRQECFKACKAVCDDALKSCKDS